MWDLNRLLAKWREREQRLEAGLDPAFARRLDALRQDHARLLVGSPRRLAMPAVPSVHRTAETETSLPAGRSR